MFTHGYYRPVGYVTYGVPKSGSLLFRVFRAFHIAIIKDKMVKITNCAEYEAAIMAELAIDHHYEGIYDLMHLWEQEDDAAEKDNILTDLLVESMDLKNSLSI